MVFESLFDKTGKRKSLESDSSGVAKKKQRKRRKSQTADDKVVDLGTINETSRTKAITSVSTSCPLNKNIEEKVERNLTKHNHSGESRRNHSRNPPSKEALELSSRLKEFSAKKCLGDAMHLYFSEVYDDIRDNHHACCILDCAARCGAIEDAERIWNELKIPKKGRIIIPTVETYTALLKAYAHAGQMHKGARIFDELCQQTSPNVRTLNTILRGCLWTAATIQNQEIAGGIVTSALAWKRAGKLNQDSSSFEYYVTQLCQAMRLQEANEEIKRLKQMMKISTTTNKHGDLYQCEDSSSLESLSICLMAHGRAQAMLGHYEAALHSIRSCINATTAIEDLISKPRNGLGESSNRKQGGKRSWKKNNEDGYRAESNHLFRRHRLTEIKNEAKSLCNVILHNKAKLGKDSAKETCTLLMTRLFYFSGGGSTGLSAHNGTRNSSRSDTRISEKTFRDVMITKWVSFGLKTSYLQFEGNADLEASNQLTTKQCNEIVHRLNLGSLKSFDSQGFMLFSHLFSSFESAQTNRALDIELGSGFGDWVIHQARSKPERDFVAVELRADRVAQTFSRLVLSETPLTNLICVGAECGSFLSTRVKENSVSTIFVNHPEPPTQTYGADNDALSRISGGGDEPGHMLNSSILVLALKCLKQSSGRLIIVTDNRMYARLICASLSKVALKLQPGSVEQLSLPSMRSIETLGSFSVYEGQPGEEIGHARIALNSGQSYFDRLWKTGAGAHSERNKRFIIAVRKSNKNNI